MDQYESPYLGQLAFHNECDEGEDEDDIGKPSTYAERGRVLPSRHLTGALTNPTTVCRMIGAALQIGHSHTGAVLDTALIHNRCACFSRNKFEYICHRYGRALSN